MTKLAGAIAQFLVMMIYLLVGVRSVTNQISDWENAASAGRCTMEEKVVQIESLLAEVPTSKTNALLACMTILPIVFLLVAYAIYKKKYIITEQFYDEITEEIRNESAESRR